MTHFKWLRYWIFVMVSFLIFYHLACSNNNSPSSPTSKSIPAVPSFSFSSFFGNSGSTTMLAPNGVGISGETAWVTSPDYVYLQAWTTGGSISLAVTTYNGTPIDPWGLGIGPDGFVYVANSGYGQVDVFSPIGIPVTSFGQAQFLTTIDPVAVAINQNFAYVVSDTNSTVYRYLINNTGVNKTFSYQFSFGTTGTGTLNTPFGIGLDNSGNVYVSDTGNNRIVKFDYSGNYQMAVTSMVSSPNDVKIDSLGNIYAANGPPLNDVQIFNSSGSPLTQIGKPYLGCPTGIAFDSSWNLYVADGCNNHLTVFNKN